MATSKTIENPEVPGLECLLPPPPPPPPPPVKSSVDKVPTTTQQQQPLVTAATMATVASVCTVQGLSPPFQNIAATSPYFLHPAMQPQAVGQSATPWWIPTDADSPELYTQWYDTTYNANTAAAVQASGKTKNKYYKRKNELIDPAQDAEKVASAQRELSALMKPLKCDLCNAVMNSTLQAKLHYDGKPHQKKVSMFLNQSVKKLKSEDGQVTSTTGNEWNTYCDICKTWFTSQTDATQHYAGKKHVRAANGGPRMRSSKKFQSQNQYSQVDSTGRFGIGAAFQNESQTKTAPIPPVVEANVPVTVPVPVPVPVPVTGPVYTPPPYPTPLRCDLCGVSANRQDQLETHRRGARHLRMLKLNGLPLPEPVPECESVPTAAGPIDYSIYRTPSGQYYCAPCNLSLNSESSFAQHVESKKHKNQLNPKSPSTAAVVAKKTRFKKK